MNKAIFFTPESPSYDSSGGRVVLSDLLSLLVSFQVIYLGPKISDKVALLLQGHGLIEYRYLSDHFPLSRIFCFITLQRNKYELNACILTVLLYFKCPNLSFFFQQYTRSWSCLYLYSRLFKNESTVVRIHNIENQYYAQNHKKRLLARFHIYVSELLSSNIAMNFITLSRSDYSFFVKKLPNTVNVKWCLPRDVPQEMALLSANAYSDLQLEKHDFLLLADYRAKFNIDSLRAFVNANIKFLDFHNLKVLVAGRKPTIYQDKIYLEELNAIPNFSVLTDFTDVSIVYQQCSILVLPDLYGAGLKMRVIESFRFNTPIIATKEVLDGYGMLPSEICIILPPNHLLLPSIECINSLKSSAKNALCFEYWSSNFKSIAS